MLYTSAAPTTISLSPSLMAWAVVSLALFALVLWVLLRMAGFRLPRRSR